MEEVAKIKRLITVSEKTEEWVVIYCDNDEEIAECIGDPDFVWPILLKSCEKLIKENRTTLPSIEIRCLGMIGSVWISINRSDVVNTLTKMLKWREGREEYEECSYIAKLIQLSIQSGNI